MVVLARAGQALGAWGQDWSHVGFAYLEQPARGDLPGVWRIVHKLNDCSGSQASLYRDGVGNFFLDRMHAYRAVFVPLNVAAAAHVLPVLTDRALVARWHMRDYSLVSHAWGQRYQQSNQWVLETLAGAQAKAGGVGPDTVMPVNRFVAQQWLSTHGYWPDTLDVPTWKRIGALATSSSVHFDDHPVKDRFDNRISTITADSMLRWLPKSGVGATPVKVALPKG